MKSAYTPKMMRLSPEQVESMRMDASKQAPEEACGLLAGWQEGNSVVVAEVFALENMLHSPIRYQLEPRQQLEVFLKIEKRGLELVGIYHSHPLGPDRPSPTDLAEVYYPDVVYLIWFPQGGSWGCRGFSIRGQEAASVELVISKDE